MSIKVGIGQDSHRFSDGSDGKLLIIGGVIFEGMPGFIANSDGDVVLHAICNAISSITGVIILGAVADEMCLKQGITDSKFYLFEALKTLQDSKILHIAITIEGKKPKFLPKIEEMRKRIAALCGIQSSQVGITATTGEGLTDFGLGLGVQTFVIITVAS